jgi:hypothetical protein
MNSTTMAVAMAPVDASFARHRGFATTKRTSSPIRNVAREREPIELAAVRDGAPEMQQRQRPDRHREDGGREIRRRYSHKIDAGHQQRAERGVSFAQRCPPEHEHGPQRNDNANLRQNIHAE